MTGVGIGLVVVAYSVGLWGYCMVRGYNVTFIQLWTTATPKWPPLLMDATQTFPSGTAHEAFGSNQQGQNN
jgi:hypothetical protein